MSGAWRATARGQRRGRKFGRFDRIRRRGANETVWHCSAVVLHCDSYNSFRPEQLCTGDTHRVHLHRGEAASDDMPRRNDPLRAFSGTSTPAPYTYVSVAGFFSAGDGAGGQFFSLGSTAGGPPQCVSYLGGQGDIKQGENTVKSLSPHLPTAGIVVGESVSGGIGIAGIPPGAEVASVDPSGT